MNAIPWIVGLLGIVVCAWLLQQLIVNTIHKEGFQLEPEERISHEEFSYNLLQIVKGPIRRLSSRLLDISVWRERLDMVQLSPVELARRNLRAQ